jgi:phosphonopyruvate decarboxylase
VISADDFINDALQRGHSFYTGVPCSFLTPFINRAIGDERLGYVAAASEGEAVGIGAGAWLAGRKPVVMFQNSGLGNAVNPLTSLNFPFRIPLLLIASWRGQPGLADEPQHELMGQITHELFGLMRIPCAPFPKAVQDIGPALDTAERAMTQTGLPFGLVMEKGTVRDSGDRPAELKAARSGERSDLRRHAPPPSRVEVLARVQAQVPADAVIVATTGKCGRELFTLDDRAQQLYLVGSMGCASAVALGIALNSPRKVVALDGDGAALMKMGNFATIGAYRPANLIHVLLDNGVHDSTGGQRTVSPGVDFAAVAAACGYARAVLVDSLPMFERAFADALSSPGPHLVHVRIAPGSLEKLGRPTITPAEVAKRLQRFLAGS